jgi:hypothetical protein
VPCLWAVRGREDPRVLLHSASRGDPSPVRFAPRRARMIDYAKYEVLLTDKA